MNYPKTDWIDEFTDGEIGNYKPTGKKILYVGFDTEYTRVTKNSNLCLSYQCSVLDAVTGEHRTGIHYPDLSVGERLSFKEFILLIFMMMDIDPADMSGYHIIFICHFCSAEFAMFRDRKTNARYLDFLHKSVVTLRGQGISFTLDDGSACKLTFEVGDTMLLLPKSHQSLEKASTLLGERFHKMDLTQDEKDHMDVLLKRDPKRFEEYALHDALITLMLFIKLQFTLNTISGSKNTRFITVSSATVKYFLKKMGKDVHKSQFGKSNAIYLQGLNLAKRAYLGGLNTSFILGKIEDELILDADFSSAYGTVMNLLEVSDFGKPIVKVDVDVDPFSIGDIDD